MRNVRLTLRNLLREPGYTLAIVATLALTISANSAIFSAVYAVLLKPLPIRDPSGLVICWQSDRMRHLAVVELSYRQFQEWADHSKSFSQTAAIGSSTWPVILDEGAESVRLASAGVSVSFFDTLGVRPQLGRGFRAEDDVPNAPRTVVLSHRTWIARFGGDRGVIGRTIQLGRLHTVVGVMPQDFDYPPGTDVWTPVVPILADSSGKWHTDSLAHVGVLFVIGRLREGITAAMAREDLGRAAVVTPFLDYLIGPVRSALWALLGAVGLLLLIGCANVSGLMLTRVSLRRREQAIQLALGAPLGKLGRSWAIEVSMLSAVGGSLGLVVARWLVSAVVALAPEEVPRISDISINLPVAAFTFGAVLLTAIVCGAEPIRQVGISNLFEDLRGGAGSTASRRSHRARASLLVFQIGLSVVLLVASGLVVRSFIKLRQIDLGFSPASVLTMNVEPRAGQPFTNDWMRELLSRVVALPGVEAAGAVYLRPLALGPIGQETSVVLEGQPDTVEAARTNPTLNHQVATPGYFATMRIPLQRGRLFTDNDNARSRQVVLVGASTARTLWPGQDPITKRILMPTPSPGGPAGAWRTVIGVVGDVRYRGVDDVRLDVYDAALQTRTAATDLVVRTTGNALSVAGAVVAEARRLDPQVVVDRLTTMDSIVSRAVAPWRFSAWMFTVFAGLAFVLATVGLVGVVALDVADRRHEFAVRLALGARRDHVLRFVLYKAIRSVMPGLLLGSAAAAAAARGIRSILFGVATLDAGTYLIVIGLVVVVVTAAAYLPARRAAAIDPMTLLRRD